MPGTPPISSTPTIQWIVDGELFRDEVLYTIRILASLVGLRPIILAPGAIPSETIPAVRYSADPTAIEGPALRLSADVGFWALLDSGAPIGPQSRRVWRDLAFPVWGEFGAATSAPIGSESCPVDPVAAAFFLVSRVEEWRSNAQDRHGRFPADQSWLVQQELIDRPLVNEYAAAIAEAVGIRDPFQGMHRIWPGGKQFALAFTHDIDRLRMHGPLWQDIRRAAGALRFPGGARAALSRFQSRWLVKSGRARDPYDTFERLTRLHKDAGNSATFFWINSAPSVRNSDYRANSEHVRELIRALAGHGFECGLHGSYDSFVSAASLAREREGIEAATGLSVRSIRQHYLRLCPGDTWRAQVASGFRFDSTLGYASRMGFRGGIGAPFRPWDFQSRRPFDLWEVPLVVMDGTAREYMRLEPSQALDISGAILRRLAGVGGAAAVLWHNSSFDNVDWRGWSDVYDGWITSASELGGWGGTVSGIAEAWQNYVDALPSGPP